ncbi:MAG: hypothetical protein QOK47_388, partial [Actinomycetota bacterium]|nr:hypothetical protein [Actinomycetota bacterium]
MNPHLKRGHILIENVTPQVDCGRYQVKAIVGDSVAVSADIFRDGTDELQAVIRFRGLGTSSGAGGLKSQPKRKWSEAPLRHVENDRWEGSFQPTELGVCEYSIEAWTDRFATWRRDLGKRVEAGQDVDLELEEGALLLEARLELIPARQRKTVEKAIEIIRAKPADAKKPDPRIKAALDDKIERLMARYPDRSGST